MSVGSMATSGFFAAFSGLHLNGNSYRNCPLCMGSQARKFRDRVISFEEEQKYLAAAGPNLRALTILAVDTRMRPHSELFCLECPQVQLEISDFMPNGYIKVKEGKTKSAERMLPLDPSGKGSASYVTDRSSEEAMAIPGPGNSGHLTSIQKSQLRAIRKVELERFPFYSWRHTFGTRCAESGMDRHTLAKLMDHSSPRITEKCYIHVTEPHISSGFERFMAYQAKRLAGSQTVTPAQ